KSLDCDPYGGVNLKHTNDIHPRHCLELCNNYKQKYALLNLNKCLCTNVLPKKKKNNLLTQFDLSCTRQCSANYFYTCGNPTNSSLYSMYTMELNCPTDKIKQRCIYINTETKTNSLVRAKNICKSKGGILAKINDILTIQDVLSRLTFILDDIFSYSLSRDDLILYERKRYFWINRTYNIIDNNTSLDRSIGRCSERSESIDENCIVLRYQKISIEHMPSYERCFTESDECSSEFALPVCIDKYLGSNSTIIIPSINDNNSSITSIHTLIDYTCQFDQDYHLIYNYCYKINFHEMNWQDAKDECERDNAILFIPEKPIILEMIKLLLLRRRSYTSSNIVHLGIIYNNKNGTVIKYNTKNGEIVKNSNSSNSIYYECGSTFRRRYEKLLSLSYLSKKEKDQLKSQFIGYGYVDFQDDKKPSIECDEISSNRLATVICQKLPIQKTRAIIAKRDYTDEPVDDDESNNPITKKSFGIDFAPLFFIFGILFAFILLVFIVKLYKQYLTRKTNNRQQNNSVYSQLLTTNEYLLN
ncbi:unnamed protein product, partial [Rotaria sp. Silwood2]